MGRKKNGGFFSRWMKSDLPDREETPAPVLLLAVHKTSPNLHRDKPVSPDCFVLPCSKQFDGLTLPTDRHRHLLSQLNERFRKTLSLDSRTDQNASAQNNRPKSMVNAPNYTLNNCSNNLPNTSKTSDKVFKKKRFRPKSFFSLETFLDSRRSEGSSVDDFSSSKYCKFYLDSSAECSPVLKGRTTPDLLDIPAITDANSHFSDETRCKKRLDKLENHFNKIQKLKNSQKSTTIDPSIFVRYNCHNEGEPIYAEPLYDGSIASQTTLDIGSKTDEDKKSQLPNNIENQFVNRPDIDLETSKVQSVNQEISKYYTISDSATYSLRSDKNKAASDYTECDAPLSGYNNNRKSSFKTSIIPLNDRQNNNEINQEDTQSSVTHCNGFRDCTNTLRDACNTNCSNSLRIIKSKGLCCKEGTPSSAYEIHITEDDQLINAKTKNLVVKTMDKSVDSIGSCSLDVDAENTDFSDTTSGSLNILTPSSTTSHYRDFTSKFHERATPGLHQNLRSLPLKEENIISLNNPEDLFVATDYSFSNVPQPKKPSYLHLACSVSGYSNLTTYDSTLRQKLNKSREHSPARLGNISSFVMLRNYPDDTMANRLNSNNSNGINKTNAPPFFKSSFSETSISSQNAVPYLKSNGQNVTSETHPSKSFHTISNGSGTESPSKSFIQQKVERLYGPGALAQGFFNQKKSPNKDNGNAERIINNNESHCTRTEHAVGRNSTNGVKSENYYSTLEQKNGDSDLPVMRHLRPEFRAQLPILSPKRSPLSKSTDNNYHIINSNNVNKLESSFARLGGCDIVDRGVTNGTENSIVNCKPDEKQPVVTIIPKMLSESSNNISSNGDAIPKTGVFSNTDKAFDNVHKNGADLTVKNVDVNNDVSYENIPVIKSNNSKPSSDNIQIVDEIADNITVNNAIDAPLSEVEEDGHYFLALNQSETVRLQQLAKLAEQNLEEVQNSNEVSEEVRGFLRVAAGKARLLASEKMKQFEGLCIKNINDRPDSKFHTTIEDLKGFWDMVNLQIDDIRILFEQMEVMKKSNWQELPPSKKPLDGPPKSTSGRPNASTSKKTKVDAAASSKALAMAKKRDEQRKAMIEAKRRAAKSQQNTSVEIFAHPPPSSENS